MVILSVVLFQKISYYNCISFFMLRAQTGVCCVVHVVRMLVIKNDISFNI